MAAASSTAMSPGRHEYHGSGDRKRSSTGFFFQAEDGIRDYKVTGVQTLSLPICSESIVGPASQFAVEPCPGRPPVALHRDRKSRVGKECRSRWSPYHLKKKK